MTSPSRRFAGPLLGLPAMAWLLAAVLAVYGFTLGFGFVYDDHVQVERNPWLQAPGGLRLFLTRPFWGFDRGQGPSNYYRPAFGAFDSLLARLWGLDPLAFHGASVVLHLAVCLLVALGARRLVEGLGANFAKGPPHCRDAPWGTPRGVSGAERTIQPATACPRGDGEKPADNRRTRDAPRGSPWASLHWGGTLSGQPAAMAAVTAGLLFAVHPAHAEAVAWAGGQPDLLAALFALTAVLIYLRDKDTPPAAQRLWILDFGFWIGPFAYLLACLAKETGVATLLVLVALEITEWRREGSPALALRRLAPYGLVLAVYLALRLHALGGFAPRDYGVTASAAGAVGYAGALLARYLGFLVVPFPAQVLTTVPVPPLLSVAALSGLAAAGLALAGLAAAAWKGSGRREIVLPLAFFFAFLLPVLRADSIGGANFAERYLYLPSVGLAWLAGLLASRLGRFRARQTLAVTGLAAVAALGTAAAVRAAIYRNDLSLFTAAVRDNPRSEIARNNLGVALYAAGRLDEAEHEYQEALRLRPDAVAPLANRALLRERRGDLAGARADFEETLRRQPTHAVAAAHLARLTEGGGRSLPPSSKPRRTFWSP